MDINEFSQLVVLGLTYGVIFALIWIVWRFKGIGQEDALNRGLNSWLEKWVDSHTEEELVNFVRSYDERMIS